MTWSQIGWAIIALGALLLLGLRFLFMQGRHGYDVRKMPIVDTFLDQRVSSIERGLGRHMILGDTFWSRPYPGLGLHALTVLNRLVSPGSMADGLENINAGAGGLVLFARQIVLGQYQDGFSERLSVSVPGPTPLSFLAGLLPEINRQPLGSLAIFGHYGSTAPLWTEGAALKGADSFAAAGTLSAQAALFLNMRDVLIGEEIFMLPGLFNPMPQTHAGWLTEDILRVVLMLLIVGAALLQIAGVL
jgi:hypothetical protein